MRVFCLQCKFHDEEIRICDECTEASFHQHYTHMKEETMLHRIVKDRDIYSLSEQEQWMLYNSGLLQDRYLDDDLVRTLHAMLKNKYKGVAVVARARNLN